MIKSISNAVYPQSEFVQVYTSTNTIILNVNIVGSCKAEDDGSEYFLGPFRLLSKYLHSSIPQFITDIYFGIGLNTLIRPLVGRIL